MKQATSDFNRIPGFKLPVVNKVSDEIYHNKVKHPPMLKITDSGEDREWDNLSPGLFCAPHFKEISGELLICRIALFCPADASDELAEATQKPPKSNSNEDS